MSRQFLPADVWIYIAENFLRKQDCLNLARTTRDTRACLLPLVFRTLRFNGHITPADTQACVREDITAQEYLGYLQFHQERIEGLQTKSSYLLDCVKSVEIWNWAYMPSNVLQTSSPNSKSTLSSQVLDSWFLTYKKIIDFAIKLPAIRTLVFHECQYGRSLHGDALPFGYTTILPSTNTLGCGYTGCEWFHYSCENLSPSSFRTPGQFIYQRDASDIKVTLRKKYLKEILQVCPLPLIEFRHTLVTIFSWDVYSWSATFRDPKKLTGLALVGTSHTWDHFVSDRLYDLFAKCPNLISLELPSSLKAFSDDLIPTILLPNLQSICAPTKVASQIVPGRPLHTIRLRESSDMYSNIGFIQESSTRVQLLDLVGLSFLSSHILAALRVAPELEVLLVQYWDKSLDSPQKFIYDTLTALIAHRKLRIFGFLRVPMDKDLFPTRSQPLSFFMGKKYHPSLEVMYFGPEVKLIWEPGLGWINVFPTVMPSSAFKRQDMELYGSSGEPIVYDGLATPMDKRSGNVNTMMPYLRF